VTPPADRPQSAAIKQLLHPADHRPPTRAVIRQLLHTPDPDAVIKQLLHADHVT
jgi:hypothetical protein